MPRWLLLSALTLLLFGGWGVLPKALAPEIDGFQSLALSTAGLLPVLAVLGFSRRPREGSARGKGAVLAFLAGLLAAAGNVVYFDALRRGGKAMTVTPLTALYPLVTVALAMVFLREKPSPAQAAGIAVALGAIYLFNPLAEGADLGSLGAHALVPIGLWGVSALFQKLSTDHASSGLSSFWFLAAFLPAAGAILLWRGGIGGPSPRDWAFLVLLGLLFGLGNLSLIAAYGSGGKASVVTPLAGLYPVVTVALAMLFFGERVRPREAGGIALALAAVVLLSLERRKEAQVDGQAS